MSHLGPCRVRSPLAPAFPAEADGDGELFEDERILLDDTVRGTGEPAGRASFELARPRRHLCFDPGEVTAGIVTCGGLCPGLNDVIRGLVSEMRRHYRVARIVGLRNGYQGLTADARSVRSGVAVVELMGASCSCPWR